MGHLWAWVRLVLLAVVVILLVANLFKRRDGGGRDGAERGSNIYLRPISLERAVGESHELREMIISRSVSDEREDENLLPPPLPEFLFYDEEGLTRTHRLLRNGMQRQSEIGIPQHMLNMVVDHEGMWRYIPYYVERTWAYIRLSLPLREFNKKWYFLDFSKPTNACRVVSMGVGKEITFETTFKRHYPQCHFVGVDPDKEKNGELFEKGLGERSKFIQAAVHGTSGTHEGHFLVDGNYEAKDAEHIGIGEFFAQHFNTGAVVDLLNLDVEGAEYSILGWLAGEQSKSLAIVICQINVEFHYSIETYRSDYGTFFADLAKLMSTHAFMRAFHFSGWPTLRAYFFNTNATECIGKFT